jgi:hypothetical protein
VRSLSSGALLLRDAAPRRLFIFTRVIKELKATQEKIKMKKKLEAHKIK